MKNKETTKVCKTCKIEKTINDFALDHDSKSGRYFQCKMCTALANKKSKNKKKEGIIIAF